MGKKRLLAPPILTEKDRAKFDAYTAKGPGCWEWTRSVCGGGYGSFCTNCSTVTAHRAAWAFANGEWPPKGKVVMHLCDNRRCVRPDHLRLGTQSENLRDAFAKGRHRFTRWEDRPAFRNPELRQRGERSGMAKLTNASAIDVKRSHLSIRDLARMYGVSESTIRECKAGRSWSHLNSEAGLHVQ